MIAQENSAVSNNASPDTGAASAAGTSPPGATNSATSVNNAVANEPDSSGDKNVVQANGEVKSATANVTSEAGQAVVDEGVGKVSLNTGAGITPDSPFYFVEKGVLSKFRSDINNREKKIAEIRKMVQKGDIASAKKALEEYKPYADRVEKNIDPERQLEARKSAEAIRVAIKEIEQEIPKEERTELVDRVVERENNITLAAKVANQIKELCESLSKLDPQQYARVCKAEGEAPQWQKKLDEQLTKEQQKEAEEFFKIMSNCFKNPKTCECDKVNVASFAAMCKEKSALAAKCEEGDKSACENFTNSEDPTDLLPAYLQDVMAQVQKEYGQAEDNLAFGKYMPEECVKANAKTPKECRAVMFKTGAPEECVKAGLTGQPGDEKKCEEIMFKANAPEECIKSGITNPKDCGKFMFKTNAPQECLDAGLTGESRNDEKKCNEISKRINVNKQNMGKQGKTSGKDCKSIQDANEKMKCFEEFYNEMSGRYTDFEDKMISEAIDSRTGEKISAEEEKQRKLCKDKGMGTILEYKNGKRIVICVDKNNPNINYGGQKCPDGVCDDYEMSHPYSCPQDCGGESMNYQQPMQQNYMQSQAQCPQGNRMQCDNNGKCFCINEQAQQNQKPEVYQQPKQTDQYQGNVCAGAGQAPNCANGAPMCQSGNWVCPQPQQEQQPVNRIDQPQQPAEQLPQQQQTQTQPAPGPGASYPPGDNQPQLAPVPGTENPPPQGAPSGSSGGNSGGGSAPVTGGVIGGDNAFLNFYFGK